MPKWTDFLMYMTCALVVTALVHGLLRAWLRPLFSSSPRRLGPWLGLAALFPLGMLGLLFMNALPRWLAAPLFWISFSWVGLCYFLLWTAPLTWLLLPLLRRGLKAHRAVDKTTALDAAQPADGSHSPAVDIPSACRPSPGSADPDRVARLVPCGVAVALALYASVQGLRPPATTQQTIELSRWPQAADGYRIAHISDLHVGATIGRAHVQAVVDAINQKDVDLVAITGDLVDGSVAALGPQLAPLSGLRSRHGVFLALGNHEYFSPTEDWVRFLPSLGIVVLRNQLFALPDFDLIGLDEWSAPEFTPLHRPDVDAALQGRRRDRPAIVLSHQPQAARTLRSRNRQAQAAGLPAVFDLQLSGHTHGGQIAPLGQIARWDQGQLGGVTQRDGLTVHVTPGTGYWGPAMRLGSRAEVSILQLRSPRASAAPTGPPRF